MDNSKRIISGEELAWQRLKDIDSSALCKNASVRYVPDRQVYIINSLGHDYLVDDRQQSIIGLTEEAEALLKRLAYFMRLSILWYMVEAKDIGLSGRLVNPVNIRGGDIFFKGSHVLPLRSLAERYGNDPEAFLERAYKLGGVKGAIGDASCVLYPFPRVPVHLILWQADEEFDASSDILFDSTCEIHLPLDIIWSTAMFSLLAMLK